MINYLCGKGKDARFMATDDPPPSPDLREDGWKKHEREQRERWARLTYRERLDWLQQAKDFARRAIESAAKRRRSGA